MNGFSILQEDYSKKLTLIRYPCPSPYSTVSLNHLLDRIQNCRRYPLLLDALSIRSSSREVEIASGFHFQFWGSSCIEPTIGKRQRKSSCTSSCHCEPVRAWQSSRDRGVGCRDDAVGCPTLPLDCRVAALLAMTGCGQTRMAGYSSAMLFLTAKALGPSSSASTTFAGKGSYLASGW